MLSIKHAVPVMRAAGGGSIIAVSSGAGGSSAIATSGHTGALEGGIDMLVKSAAEELEPTASGSTACSPASSTTS